MLLCELKEKYFNSGDCSFRSASRIYLNEQKRKYFDIFHILYIYNVTSNCI